MNVHVALDINDSLSPPWKESNKVEEKEHGKVKVGEENFPTTANLHNISTLYASPQILSYPKITLLYFHHYKTKETQFTTGILSPSPLLQFAYSGIFIFPWMAKTGGAFVCLLIVVMDIVAGILGIEAEIAQNKVSSTWSWWVFMELNAKPWL